MNMLSNKIPFGLLQEKEKDLFRNAGANNCNRWDGSKWGLHLSTSFHTDSAYRLKLRNDEWYTLVPQGGGMNYTFQYNGGKNDFPFMMYFQPATQDEIDQVKPKEVEVSTIRESDVQILLQSEEMTDFVLGFLKDLRV